MAQRQQATVAQRLGSWPEWLLTALGVGAVVAVVVRRGAARRSAA
jgi:apolipoprotein N-acyltransferase